MASIVNRGSHYYVVYLYDDERTGKRKQKWESYSTIEAAKARKTEVEYKQTAGTFVVPVCETLEDLLKEYVSLYGKSTWSLSMYETTTRMIESYIVPYIGKMKLKDITPRVLEKYYQELLKEDALPKVTDKKRSKKKRKITPYTVNRIHSVLKSCFHQAMKWELMEKNPATLVMLPKTKSKKRKIWDADTLFHAVEVCEDEQLKLAIDLAFACTLRIGELLALTWDCVDISDESIRTGRASVYINKTLQRVSKKALQAMDMKDVLVLFPEQKNHNASVLVLKKPKTESSIRRVFLPKTVAEMLVQWKVRQDQVKEMTGDSYEDYQMVFAGEHGFPTEAARINKKFQNLILENDLPKVVFHSLRHTSITYKLKLNGGDVKSVQGDSGHAEAKMVLDQYSHILDDGRMKNAELIESAFYSGKEQMAQEASVTDTKEETLKRLLADPETAALLMTLMNKIK